MYTLHIASEHALSPETYAKRATNCVMLLADATGKQPATKTYFPLGCPICRVEFGNVLTHNTILILKQLEMSRPEYLFGRRYSRAVDCVRPWEIVICVPLTRSHPSESIANCPVCLYL